MSNRLAKEKSPYLLQHANNPVDWYPWGEEAFQKSREENKPVFLSIGYSTCHWCHVMEHESFEDPEVAKLMNEAFVNIKVDREERPDVDNIYMTVCQMMTGSGGWPLTIFLTPDRKPFYAATYIPKEPRFGRVGMLQLVPRIQEIWQQRSAEVIHSADEITQSLQQVAADSSGDLLGATALSKTQEHLTNRFDRVFGGFGDSPKFPTPHNLLFLLRNWKRTGDPRPLEMVEKTLISMRLGGIYDQVGFGFHRYSTDREWLVPHFEKMLYDQALLCMAYTDAFLATRKEEYATVAREILTYVLRDMTSPEGSFYSAEDADSEGEEGKFYFWKAEEIDEVLGPVDGEFVRTLMNVSESGNFIDQIAGHATRDNILHLQSALPDQEQKSRWETARQKLFDERRKRIPPLKDDKILVDWNGLMIAALARAGRALDEPLYTAAAQKAVKFILQSLRNADGSLIHRYREGEAALPSHLDDYAFLTWGLLELYETTFEVSLLKTAIGLADFQLLHFSDESRGGFYFTADNAEELLVRTREIYDGAVPSGNSVSMWNLLRLSRITGNMDYETLAEGVETSFSKQVIQIPSAHTMLMIGIDFRVGPTHEVVIAGPAQAAETRSLIEALNSNFFPSHVVLLRDTGQTSPEIDQVSTYTSVQSSLHGKPTAYVCSNFVCNAPTNDAQTMLDLLK